MIYLHKINTDITIKSLEDLSKLKPFLEDGTLKINKSQIARELGKDRRTVDKYLNGYQKPTTRNRHSNLDAYYNLIKELLSDENQQIFYYKRVLWQFLKDNHQLDCSQSSFRRYISRHTEFQEYFNKRKKNYVTKKSHMRFETALGKQAQLDWKESMKFILKTGEEIEINIFVLLLAHSRFRVYRLSLSKSQEILFSFLDNAFEIFGGVPSELLTDNMKTVMDQARTEQSKGKVNPRFEQFANDYGFRVHPCIAARPQTKAKVEAPMKLLDEIYAYNGLLDYHELNILIQKLNDRINHQVHPGTGKIPIMYLKKERAYLSPLPKESIRKPYQIITSTSKVNSSSMITYRSNQYSVAPEYIGKRMNLQVYDNYLYAYYNTTLVAIHPISSKKLNYLENHYISISKLTFKNESCDINAMAKKNLTQIGALFNNE
ncbi:MAG: IS21 family transposase [Turicibacter sp.]|nr:IS21 family transposase [Turicibacter sp.]